MKKLMSLILSAALMMGMAVPAFAAPADELKYFSFSNEPTGVYTIQRSRQTFDGAQYKYEPVMVTAYMLEVGTIINLSDGVDAYGMVDWDGRGYDFDWPEEGGIILEEKNKEAVVELFASDESGNSEEICIVTPDYQGELLPLGNEPEAPVIDPAPATGSAKPAKFAATLDGAPIDLTAYVINDFNHIKLRDMAALLKDTDAKFNVGWDGKSVTLTTGESYTPGADDLADVGTAAKAYTENQSAIVVDGKTVELTAYNIDGYNYFQLRDLGEALGFNVGWDNASRTVTIGTK